MDVSALPSVRRGSSVWLLGLQVVHTTAVVGLGGALTYTGLFLVKEGSQGVLGTTVLLSVALLMAAEVGLGLYLILRKRRIVQLTQSARRALLAGETEIARHNLVQLLNFFEYRLNPASVYYGLAVADISDEQLDRAHLLLKKAGPMPAAVELRVLLLLHMGLAFKAARLMAAAIAAVPQRYMYWVTLAACQQAMGEHETAKKLMQAALMRWPKATAVKQALRMLESGESLANAVLARGMPGKSSARLKAVSEAAPGSVPVPKSENAM